VLSFCHRGSESKGRTRGWGNRESPPKTLISACYSILCFLFYSVLFYTLPRHKRVPTIARSSRALDRGRGPNPGTGHGTRRSQACPALPPLPCYYFCSSSCSCSPYPLLHARAALAEEALSELVHDGGDFLGATKLRIELLQLAGRKRRIAKPSEICKSPMARVIKPQARG